MKAALVLGCRFAFVLPFLDVALERGDLLVHTSVKLLYLPSPLFWSQHVEVRLGEETALLTELAEPGLALVGRKILNLVAQFREVLAALLELLTGDGATALGLLFAEFAYPGLPFLGSQVLDPLAQLFACGGARRRRGIFISATARQTSKRQQT